VAIWFSCAAESLHFFKTGNMLIFLTQNHLILIFEKFRRLELIYIYLCVNKFVKIFMSAVCLHEKCILQRQGDNRWLDNDFLMHDFYILYLYVHSRDLSLGWILGGYIINGVQALKWCGPSSELKRIQLRCGSTPKIQVSNFNGICQRTQNL
jgi:hypothetical protein